MTQFDGPNRLITLDTPTAGVLNVLVQRDLYSEAKVWLTGELSFSTLNDVNATTERVTIVDHSTHTGQPASYSDGGGSADMGLVDGVTYFLRRIDRDTVEFYDTRGNAENTLSTTGRIDLLVTTDETHTIVVDNSKFLPPFRTAGGDPLTPGVESGAYFFLQNQAGSDWRITSTDADQTVNYDGNLVGEDAAITLITATPGRTVLHLGLQPVTQRVDEILRQSQEAAYNGKVVYRASSTNSGTEFPVGTASRPVNNVLDFFSIAANLSIQKGGIAETFIADRNMEGWGLTGESAVDNDLIQLGGFSFEATRFQGLTLTGTMTGIVETIECKLLVTLGMNGFFRRCGLEGILSTAASSICTFDSCFSRVGAGLVPELQIGADSIVGIQNWSGELRLSSMSSGTTVSLGADPGIITIDASCTGGTLILKGVGTITDESGGAVTIVRDGFIDGVDLNALIQSSVGNADVSSDDLTVTIRNPDLTVLRTLSVSADGRIRRIL